MLTKQTKQIDILLQASGNAELESWGGSVSEWLTIHD